MRITEVIPVAADTSRSHLVAEIRELLTGLEFRILSATTEGIQAVKSAPLGVNEFVLKIAFGDEDVHLDARPRVRSVFWQLLPLTGCGLLCGVTCGATCTTACSCGAGTFLIGQAASGVRSYSHHLFQLIAAVIEEKGHSTGHCAHCGTPMPTAAKFCRKCGREA